MKNQPKAFEMLDRSPQDALAVVLQFEEPVEGRCRPWVAGDWRTRPEVAQQRAPSDKAERRGNSYRGHKIRNGTREWRAQ